MDQRPDAGKATAEEGSRAEPEGGAGEQEAVPQGRKQYLAELKQELLGGGLLTAAEVADILEIHPRTVTEYIRTGALPAYQFGGAWKVSEATLRAFLRQQAPQQSSPQAAGKPQAPGKSQAGPALPWHRKSRGFRCSFCGKEQEQVRRLVAGPNVYICDECVALCNEIIAAERPDAAAEE